MWKRFHVKCPPFFSDFDKTLTFSTNFSNNIRISNLVKICHVGAELSLADGQTDGWTDGRTDKHDEAISFRSFANAQVCHSSILKTEAVLCFKKFVSIKLQESYFSIHESVYRFDFYRKHIWGFCNISIVIGTIKAEWLTFVSCSWRRMLFLLRVAVSSHSDIRTCPPFFPKYLLLSINTGLTCSADYLICCFSCRDLTSSNKTVRQY